MKIGMLWLDDDKRRSLEEKVRRAAEYYEMKYGRTPDRCYVNNNVLTEEKAVDRLQLKPAAHILPHYFWIGIQGADGVSQAPNN